MRLAAILLAVLLGAGAAQAEVSVRSGEHDTFSRLVFTTPPGTDWTLSQEGQRATVTLSNESERFDVSDIFARIPKTRLTNARDLGRGKLELALNCDCPINAFQLNNQVFVVDIQNPTETAALSESAAPQASRETTDIARFELPVIPPTTRQDGVVPPLGFRGLNVPSLAMRPQVPDSDGPIDLAETRTRLIDEISRASGQGLLETKTDDAASITETPPVAVLPESTGQEQGDTRPRENVPISSVNLRAESSVDEALAEVMLQFLGKQPDSTCLSDETLNVSAWSSGEGYRQEVGQLYRQLYGEFDRLDVDIATDLAKLYISFGFGAEALFVLQLVDGTPPDHDMLTAMAETMEYGAARDPNVFQDQSSCDTAAAFWSVMADLQFSPDGDLNTSAVLRSFDALPLHLRRYLGPMLSERLRVAGHTEVAQDVMRIVTRGNRQNDSSADMELSQIALVKGEVAVAEQGLSEVVLDNSPPSPRALIDLIDLRISEGEAIEAELATLAAAYAFEFRNSEMGIALQRAHVLALMDSGQYTAAVKGLEDLAGELLPEKERATRSAVFDGITEHAPDPVFLELVIPYFSQSEHSVNQDIENRIARRLLDLGISDPVGHLLTEGVSGPDGRERRILRARLAMLENRPRNAIAHLLGLEGEDIDILRAQAFETLAEYDRAKRLYESLGLEEDAKEMALLAKDWTYLQAEGAGTLASTADARLQDVTRDFSVPGIQSSLDALTNSQATQERVQALLGDFQVDAAPRDPSQ